MGSRIAPGFVVALGACLLLLACGDGRDPHSLPKAASAATGVAVPPNDPGEAVWKKTCAPCHDGGLGDGPALGDALAWKPRTEQGMAVLRDHALNGFSGTIGDMPARGGDDTLTDADVDAALTYMVARSR